MKLWNTFTGRTDVAEQQPSDDGFFNEWKSLATTNSDKFENVFRVAPNNTEDCVCEK